MNVFKELKKFWEFLKEDTWQSWLVSLVLAFLVIKFVFFPSLSFVMGTSLPLVVVESCSMYHSTDFDKWFESNALWYKTKDIEREDFASFPFKNGLNKGDIILVTGRGNYELGDVIIFDSDFKFPLIHRVVELSSLGTKGDNNANQLPQEKNIDDKKVLGRALFRIPGLGWVKLIFFEGLRPKEQRGFCK